MGSVFIFIVSDYGKPHCVCVIFSLLLWGIIGVWDESSEFLKAISQLFDRYLTWRDSKVALMLFVKNKDISNVVKTIKNDISQHEYYLKYKSDRGESSFSYEFHLPNDKAKKVELEVMTFHFDKE